jgi:hypothetical protein
MAMARSSMKALTRQLIRAREPRDGVSIATLLRVDDEGAPALVMLEGRAEVVAFGAMRAQDGRSSGLSRTKTDMPQMERGWATKS